jgi:hypothetical protein
MFAELIRRYLLTCGWLLAPIIVWNLVLTVHLPPPISNSESWGAIPQPLALAENTLRIFVFAIPFFMPLQVSTRRQKAGVALFIVGTLVYFASWLALIAAPQSGWSSSAIGFLAPAYTGESCLGAAIFARGSMQRYRRSLSWLTYHMPPSFSLTTTRAWWPNNRPRRHGIVAA